MAGVGEADLPPLRFDPEHDPLFFTHHPNWNLPALEAVPIGSVFRIVRAGSPPPEPMLPSGPLAGEDDPRVPKDYLTQNLIGHFHYMLGVTFETRDWPRARARARGGRARGARERRALLQPGAHLRAQRAARRRRRRLRARGRDQSAPPSQRRPPARERPPRRARGREAPVIRRIGLLLCALGARRSPARAPSPTHDRVIVLGLDGVDPLVVDLLLSEGKLPNFAKLRQGGAYGRLVSSKPLLSPIIWTTIATGKTPLEHGISHFVAVNAKTRRGAAGDEPDAPREGALEHPLRRRARGGRGGLVGDLAGGERARRHRERPHLLPLPVRRGRERQQRPDRRDAPARAARRDRAARAPPRRSDARGARALRRRHARGARAPVRLPGRPQPLQVGARHRAELPRDRPPALEATRAPTCSSSTSRASTRPPISSDTSSAAATSRARSPSRAGATGARSRRCTRYADEIVGAYLDALDDDTTLVVLSDHGFELGVLHEDPSRARDLRRVSERFHRIEGILYLYGNRVRAGRRLDEPAILDIAPTVLALAGVPPAADMPGRVLSGRARASAGAHGDAAAASRATRRAEPAGAPAEAKADADVSPEILEHLRALGYLDASSPKGDRNLAALHFEKGELRGGGAPLRRSRAREPRRRGPAREPTRARSGRSESSTRRSPSWAARSRSSPPTPRPTTTAARSSRSAATRRRAARAYQTALRYAPDYEPSRSALARLGGGAAAADEPQTREREARHGARRAGAPGGAARRLRGRHQEARRSRAHRPALRARRALPREHRLPAGRPRRRDQGAAPRRRARARQSAVSDEPRATGSGGTCRRVPAAQRHTPGALSHSSRSKTSRRATTASRASVTTWLPPRRSCLRCPPRRKPRLSRR